MIVVAHGLVLALVALTAACTGRLVYPSPPYGGRVVDAESGEPLAGAAVVAVWYREVPTTPHGPAEDVHETVEALTDRDGRFTIPERRYLTAIGRVRGPDLVVYFPGHAPFPSSAARPRGTDVTEAYRRGYFAIELAPLHGREARLAFARLPSDVRVPESRTPHLVRLVNEERRRLGLDPIGTSRTPR